MLLLWDLSAVRAGRTSQLIVSSRDKFGVTYFSQVQCCTPLLCCRHRITPVKWLFKCTVSASSLGLPVDQRLFQLYLSRLSFLVSIHAKPCCVSYDTNIIFWQRFYGLLFFFSFYQWRGDCIWIRKCIIVKEERKK